MVLFNTGSDVSPVQKLMQKAQYLNADIVFLQEVRRNHTDYLKDLWDTFPYQSSRQRSDNLGLAVLFKYPLEGVRIFKVAGRQVPWIEGSGQLQDKAVSFLAVHAFPRSAVSSSRPEIVT